VSQVLRTFNCQRRGPKHDPPGKLSGDFGIYKLGKKKLLVVGKEKRSVKCVLNKRSEVKLETFENSALFCFTKGLVLRNTIQ